MHTAYPIIVQDLLNMTLIRPNGERIRFKMDNDVYLTLAHTSHTPLTIYSILYSSDFDINNDSTLTKLSAYSILLEQSIIGISKSTHLNPEQKERIITLMTLSDEYLKLMLENKNTNKQEYHDFAKSVRPLVEGNLYDGATEQLIQFRKKLENWQAEYPEDR